MSNTEPKRPYYLPPPPKPKRANVIPVSDWTIAQVMFLRDKKNSNEHATAARKS